MGRYMTVVLKEAHKNDLFTDLLNQQLAEQFGSNTGIKFNTWKFLNEEADYINNDPEAAEQLAHWPRPVRAEQLHRNFFWFRIGEFSFKLSGCSGSDEARDAVAVSKWIRQTGGKYIDKKLSENYSPEIVSGYLNSLFEEAGYDLEKLWTIPTNH